MRLKIICSSRIPIYAIKWLQLSIRAYFLFLIARPKFWVPTLITLIDTFYIKLRNQITETSEIKSSLSDQEVSFFYYRAGWLIDEILTKDTESAIRAFSEMLSAKEVLKDPYSCSQRIAKITYLYRLANPKEVPQILLDCAKNDALIVSKKFEYRTSNTWFNNHLLNNYRALVLYASFFMDKADKNTIEAAILNIEKILTKNYSTLFSSKESIDLFEGSASYEIHCLKILVDLSCSPYQTALTEKIALLVSENAKKFLMKYRYQSQWMIPIIGDITPNWTRVTMVDFMDGVGLSSDTSVYRKVWAVELKRLGL